MVCGGWVTPRSGGSTPRSSSGCWLTGPVSLSRSAAGRGARPRPPRSFPSWRPSSPLTALRSSWWSPGAGMLSAANLAALDEARLRLIVGARTTRAPGDLEAHLALGRGRPRRRPGHQHHHPQEGLQEPAGQEPQGRAGVGPGHPSGLVASGVGLLQAPRGPGQPDPHGPGQPGPGRHRRREASQGHPVCPPSTPVTPPWTRPPSPGPGPWWASRATSPFVPEHLMDAAETVSSYHELWHARAVIHR